ncbi:hypothetical protein HYR99_14095 [Candidatus Poribacteria bacterium]|nr:hypothetical protein [Candidatus Poribacteria bacterium]
MITNHPNAITLTSRFYRHRRRWFPFFLVIGFVMVIEGCAAIIGQKWSENYARQPGAQSPTPAVIDGDLKTAAPLRLKIQPQKMYGYPPAEIEISLPESKVIRRIVVHSNELKDFQLWAYDAETDQWKLIRQVNGGGESKIEIRTDVQTQRIKLKVNTIAILGGRNVVEKTLKGSSEIAEGETLLERFRALVQKAQLLNELNQIEAKLPHVREIELYGYDESK